MSKYCPECGAEINDEAKVCEQCGTAIETAIEKPAEDKAAKKKKILILAGVIAGAVLVVVIALVILITSILSNFGCEGTAKRFAEAALNEDYKKMTGFVSDIVIEGFYDNDEDELEERFDREFEYMNNYFDNYIAGDYEIKYKIEDVDVYPDEVADEMFDWFEDYYDVDTDVIKKAAIVEFEVYVTEGKETYFYDVNLIMIKENLTWKVFDLDD